MKKIKTKLLIAVLVILVLGIYYYTALPAINIHATEFWVFLIILIILAGLLFVRKKNLDRNLLKIYLFIYACVRFILEFTRGDEIRGIWNGLSFSQYISIAIIILIISLSTVSNINSKEKES